MDHRQIEEKRWIGDGAIRELGEAGLCGLYVDEEYGGQGLSQTGYARVFETFAQIDATLSIVLGVHQSIGFKGIHMFGTAEQKERFLPDLAAGRKLAGFALTEPEAGSDAYAIQSRAVLQPDGSYVLNGEKRYIGNGSKGEVFTAFARCEVGGKDRHIALILEKGMRGFEVGERFDTMGLRGNDLRRLRFNDVRVPAENVLGEPGDGFRVAMQVLNNGRIGLGTGSVGATKRSARPGDRARQAAAPVRSPAGRVRARPGQDRLDGLVSVRARVGLLSDLRPGRPRGRGLLARIGDLQGLRHRVPLVCRQSHHAAARRRRLHARRAVREDPPRHPHLPDLRGRQRRPARLRRAFGDEAGRREAVRARRDRPRRPDRLDRRPGRLRRRPDPPPGPPRPAHRGPPRARAPRRLGLRAGLAAAVGERVAAARAQGGDRRAASSSRSGSRRRSPTSSPRSRCSHE